MALTLPLLFSCCVNLVVGLGAVWGLGSGSGYVGGALIGFSFRIVGDSGGVGNDCLMTLGDSGGGGGARDGILDLGDGGVGDFETSGVGGCWDSAATRGGLSCALGSC